MKIVFLIPNISDAHCLRRIENLERLGIHVNLLGFSRGYYAGKEWHGDYKILGNLKQGNYFKRLIPFLFALIEIIKAVKSADVIYAFGQDLLGLGWMASVVIRRKPIIVCEIADIQYALTRDGFLSRTLRYIERFLLHRIYLLIVTSKAFISEYYCGIQGMTNIRYQVIENKIDEYQIHFQSEVDNRAEHREDGLLRIGYFGLLRCHWSWESIKLIARRGEGRVKIYMRGPLIDKDIEREVHNFANIEYGGTFISPDELPRLYGSVDLVWAAYYKGPKPGLWSWARSNRFYEACYFKKPLICQKGTEDGRLVENLGLGSLIDLKRQEDCCDEILRIGAEQLKKWKQNIENLPANLYIYSDEHVNLVNTIHLGLRIER